MNIQVFNRFTERSKTVIRIAVQKARQLDYPEVETEHLLWGLLEERNGVAGTVLREMGIDPSIQVFISTVLGIDPRSMIVSDDPPLSRDSYAALDYAEREADSLKHDLVGTEHILLGLLRVENSSAVRIIRNFEIEPADMRREVLEFLGVEDPVNQKMPGRSILGWLSAFFRRITGRQ